ncbi:MAG: metallophosphoesterase, partial [Actinomycetota bacterium]
MGILRPDGCTEPLDLVSPGYDIIGDVHGCHDQMVELLTALGYRDTTGAFRHPTRQAIILGDLIDRGPKQVEVLRTVRAMTEAGSAQVIMGNHEFNAVCWHTPHRNKTGEFLRPHNDKNANQHAEFLRQIGAGSTDHREAVEWFATFPLWLDLG